MRLSDAVWALELAGCCRIAVAGDVRLDQADARRMACERCGRIRLRFPAWCPRCQTAVEL